MYVVYIEYRSRYDNKVFKNIKINIYTMDTDAKTMTSYEKKKPSIYKWRENNKEKYNDICNKAQVIYYVKNKERISQRKKEWYLRKKAERLAMEKSEKGKLHNLF